MSKILLIGLELADWTLLHPLLDAGVLPNLDALINRGVIADLTPASWRSAVTGLGDDAPAAPPLWEVFADAGRRSLVVRWPGSHPAKRFAAGGVYVSEGYGVPPEAEVLGGLPAIEPPEQREPLAALRLSPQQLDVRDVRKFVPALDQLGEAEGPAMNWLTGALADAGTTQRLACTLLANEPWDFAAVHHGAIGLICRQFLQPSQQPDSVYAGVPASSVALADTLIGKLVEIAGEDTITCICSAYGLFGSAVGIVAGPGIREDERLALPAGTKASILDIAPTLRALAGLAPADGLPGRVWELTNEE